MLRYHVSKLYSGPNGLGIPEFVYAETKNMEPSVTLSCETSHLVRGGEDSIVSHYRVAHESWMITGFSLNCGCS